MTEQNLKDAERKAWVSGQKIAAIVGAAVVVTSASEPFPQSIGAALVGAIIGAVLWRWVHGEKP